MSTTTEKTKKLAAHVKTAVDQAAQLAAGAKTTAVKTTGQTAAGQGGTGYVEYTGGDQELDRALKSLSDQYSQARERALAGETAAVSEMRQANDKANQLRNEKGYAAQLADKDITYVKSLSEGASGQKEAGTAGGTVRTQQVTTTAAAAAPQVNDYSGYLEEMAKAKKEAAIAQLQAAYEKNLAQLDKAGEDITPAYTAARNAAAGQAEKSKRQFNEYAAANGLGSGAGGQAQLAIGNQLQGTLGDLDAREADALSALELQRTQTQLNYNAAIAKAQADGDYELAEQLYREKVRQDEAMVDQMKWQAQQDYQKAYFGWQQEQADRSAALQQAGRAQEQEEALRALLLQYAAGTGDYSGLGGVYTPEQIARLEEVWNAQKAAEAGQAQSDALAQRRAEADWAAKYGDYSGLKALGVDTTALEQAQAAKAAESAAKSTSSAARSSSSSSAYKPKLTASQVDKAISNGLVTDQVKADFAYYYGADYDKVFGSESGQEGESGQTQTGGTVTEARFTAALRTIATLLSQGETELAHQGAQSLEGKLDPRQKERLEEVWAKYAG